VNSTELFLNGSVEAPKTVNMYMTVLYSLLYSTIQLTVLYSPLQNLVILLYNIALYSTLHPTVPVLCKVLLTWELMNSRFLLLLCRNVQKRLAHLLCTFVPCSLLSLSSPGLGLVPVIIDLRSNSKGTVSMGNFFVEMLMGTESLGSRRSS